jgi:predicted lipid-binding transport protein (Tim44 family)
VSTPSPSTPSSGSAPARRQTAAPPLIARVLAIAAILVAGLSGGLIGFAVTEILCVDGCTTRAGIVGVVTAIAAASGVAIVAVLALRAMAEWHADETRAQAHRDGTA